VTNGTVLSILQIPSRTYIARDWRLAAEKCEFLPIPYSIIKMVSSNLWEVMNYITPASGNPSHNVNDYIFAIIEEDEMQNRCKKTRVCRGGDFEFCQHLTVREMMIIADKEK
jgi:hypothetical protein